MNVSPFCDMSQQSGPVGWTEDVDELYKDVETPEYIQDMKTSMRETYPTSEMRKNEMLSTLVKVI